MLGAGRRALSPGPAGPGASVPAGGEGGRVGVLRGAPARPRPHPHCLWGQAAAGFTPPTPFTKRRLDGRRSE